MRGTSDLKGKKLLILGSDYGTLQVAREAKKMGLYVIVADLMKTSPTKELADEAWYISTTDIDYLCKKCREESVFALMFGASDFNINHARQICKRLQLPIYCADDFSWKAARDKRVFKNLCKTAGAPVAQDYVVSDALSKTELASVQYPVVVKPSDQSGNRGMRYCSNEQALIAAYRNARSITEKEIIVERQLSGAEYNVHYVLAEGEAHLLYFSSAHHVPGKPSNLYSFKCTTSRHLKQYLEEVNDSVVAALKLAGCKEGIAWVDCMRDVDGQFYLLEMGYRFGGVMTYVPYEKVTGFNTVLWMLECALGITHKTCDLPLALDHALAGCAASYHLFSTQAGVIGAIEGLDEIAAMPNVFIDMPKRAGSVVRSDACIGLLGIYAQNIDELCKTLENINSVLRIKNQQGEDMILYFNDYQSLREEYAAGLLEFK